MMLKSLPKLFFLIAAFFIFQNLKAQTETEPNNTVAQANKLNLNGSGSGAVNPAGDIDWWKVTTNADGQLNVTLTLTSGISTYITIFDNDGTTLLAQSQSNTTFTVSKDGLAAGTYYIQVVCYYNTQTTSYTLSNTLTTIAQPNDAEPDSTRATALSLGLNSTKTGHIGYYYKNHRDSLDFYKITTDEDGSLQLKLTPANGTSTYVTLFDNDGTTVLGQSQSNTTFYVTKDGLAPGTYYVQVNTYYNNQFTPYTLTDSLFATGVVNDAEPDSTRATALTLAPNKTTTGHIGYYYKNHRDSLDFYKITTTKDGLLQLKLSPANGVSTYVTLYDNNGTTVLGQSQSNVPFYLNTNGLAAGTYYVQVNTYYNNQFTTYTLTDSLFVPTQANDAEPDSSRATALTLAPNSTTAGHIGYYYNNHRDTTDWYRLTTTQDGLLQLTLTPVNGTSTYVTLYDNNGTTVLNSGQSNTIFTVSKDGLAAGTYYVAVYCYYNSQFTPYTLKDSLLTIAEANDTEPTNDTAHAVTLGVNSTVSGHVGYYYNNRRDTIDWYRLTTTQDGLLRLTLTPVNGTSTYVTLYDNNGTTVLNSGQSNTTFTVSKDGLAAGTYYAAVYCYYNNQFTPYTLKDSLLTIAEANDTEPTNDTAHAVTLGVNSTVTGHVGYYYNNYRDTTDWYRLTTTQDGLLKLTLNPVNGTSTYVTLYDNNGTIVLSSGQSNTTFTVTKDGLAAGTYYAAVYCYYNSQFTPYTLKDSLFTPVQANDREPNNSTATALILPANIAVTGHVGYYYNNRRDTIDWYKLTIPNNGNIKLTLSPVNGTSTYVTLYDTNGTTVLSSNQSNSTFTISKDGLAAGTYYVAVYCYYNNQFTPYTLKDSSKTSLPVTFISFIGMLQNNVAVLNWSTANEINNKGFEVERSMDGQTFTTIGFVQGAGNSSGINNYKFTDIKIVSGSNYYRLKQVDMDGRFNYSSLIKIDLLKFAWMIYGNPVNNSHIQLMLDKQANVSVQILSLNGSVIQTINKGSLTAGSYSIPLNLNNVSAGVYVVKLLIDNQPYIARVVKQ